MHGREAGREMTGALDSLKPTREGSPEASKQKEGQGLRRGRWHVRYSAQLQCQSLGLVPLALI